MGYEVHEMNNETHEIRDYTTGVDLSLEMGVTVDRIGQMFRSFRNGGHPAFVGPFNRIAPLTPRQLAALRGEDFTIIELQKQEDNKGDVLDSIGEPEPPKEVAPVSLDVAQLDYNSLILKASYQAKWDAMKRESKRAKPVKPTTSRYQIAALAIAFIFPTVASGINTVNISHQLSSQAAVSYAILGMVSLTPILFIIARMERVGVLVAIGVVAFEAFCNVAATYLSLMGSMVYMSGVPRGACSPFLQNVVELTESAHKNTAVLIAIVLAVIVSSVQLTAFWGLKKRI